jgi:hypothetical protein
MQVMNGMAGRVYELARGSEWRKFFQPVLYTPNTLAGPAPPFSPMENCLFRAAFSSVAGTWRL